MIQYVHYVFQTFSIVVLVNHYDMCIYIYKYILYMYYITVWGLFNRTYKNGHFGNGLFWFYHINEDMCIYIYIYIWDGKPRIWKRGQRKHVFLWTGNDGVINWDHSNSAYIYIHTCMFVSMYVCNVDVYIYIYISFIYIWNCVHRYI